MSGFFSETSAMVPSQKTMVSAPQAVLLVFFTPSDLTQYDYTACGPKAMCYHGRSSQKV